MARAERIVLALRALGEAGKAAGLTQGTDAVSAAREDFVGVCLVPDVPDQAVVWCVEKIVDRNRKLDNAETRPQMATRHGNRVDQLRPQFIGELAKLIGIEFAKVFRVFDGVEERGAVADSHFTLSFRFSWSITYAEWF